MSKKRIQLTINEDLLKRAEELAKERRCDSISELVTDLLKEEDAKQLSQQVAKHAPAPPPPDKTSGVQLSKAPGLDRLKKKQMSPNGNL